MFNDKKSSNICRTMYVVPIYICTHDINPVLTTISKQSIQSCTPLINIQIAPGFHSD